MIWKGLIGGVVLLGFATSCSPSNRITSSGSDPLASVGTDPSAGPTVQSVAIDCLAQAGQACIQGTDEMFQEHTEQFGAGQYNHNKQRLLATFSLRPTEGTRLEGVATIEHTLTGDFDYVMCSGTYSMESRQYEATLTGEFAAVPGTGQVYVSFTADPLQGPPPVTSWETNCEVQPDFVPQVWEWSGFGGVLENGKYDFLADWSGLDVGEYWQKVHMEQARLQ